MLEFIEFIKLLKFNEFIKFTELSLAPKRYLQTKCITGERAFFMIDINVFTSNKEVMQWLAYRICACLFVSKITGNNSEQILMIFFKRYIDNWKRIMWLHLGNTLKYSLDPGMFWRTLHHRKIGPVSACDQSSKAKGLRSESNLLCYVTMLPMLYTTRAA